MQHIFTSRGVRLIVWTAIIGFSAIVFISALPVRTDPSQRRNMIAAQQHGTAIASRVIRDPRFSNIKFAPGTPYHGCLIVGGMVASQRDLDDLKQVVATTKPPVRTLFLVDVTSAKGDGNSITPITTAPNQSVPRRQPTQPLVP